MGDRCVCGCLYVDHVGPKFREKACWRCSCPRFRMPGEESK